MKRILTSLLILMALPILAQAQDCKVPISVLSKENQYSIRMKETELSKSFGRFLERQGFTTSVKNTRLAIFINTYVENGEQIPVCHVIDIQNKTVFFTEKFDTLEYPGSNLYRSLDDVERNPEKYRAMAANLRQIIIDLFEVNTHNMTRVGQDYAKDGNFQIALFALVQYPTCCPSYPNIRDCMLSVYREYMKEDHEALLEQAKNVWWKTTSEVEARFVISLLNSVKFDKEDQETADNLLGKVAKAYPSLNIRANEDYTFVPELKEIAVNCARAIGVDFSWSREFPETVNFIPIK